MQNSKLNVFKFDTFTKSKTELITELNESPLTPGDVLFMTDIINGLSYKELAEKYGLTVDGVYKKKVRLINNFYRYLFYQKAN